jgi:hypothetical protein
VLATVGAWIYTLVDPTRFGVCHIVPLYFGHQPSVRDCQPIEVAFFAVPIGVIALLIPFMLYLAGDAEVSIPFFGKTLLLTRQARQVGQLFDVADLGERGEAWLETLGEEEPPA